MSNNFVWLIPVIFIAIFVLSIVMFKKRKKIIEKYDVGYISSFLFAAYMLTPVTLGIPALLGGSKNDAFSLIMSVVYPLVGIIIFMAVYHDKPFEYKVGKFFAMLGLGLCAALIFVFKMLSFFHKFESARDRAQRLSNSSSNISQMLQSREIYGKDGSSKGYINENGEILGPLGESKGRINENGEILGPLGESKGRINENGEIFGPLGESMGRIN